MARQDLRRYRALLGAVLAAQAATNVAPSPSPAVAPSPDPSLSLAPSLDPSSVTPAPDPSASPAPDPSASPAPDPSASASPDPSAAADASPAPGVPAGLAAQPVSLTPEQLRAKIAQTKARVVRLARAVRRLGHRLYVERATARGDYVPLICDVARLNGVSATGLRTMMTFESGGRATAVGGGGAYRGLFQYSMSTWRAAWNPWRGCSIYDPAAQIRATARAVHLGYGPSMWPNTYWRSF